MARKESAPYGRSIAALREALKQHPDELEIMTELALLLYKVDRTDQNEEAARLIERILMRQPEATSLRRRIADYYRQSLQHQKAEIHYERLVAEHDSEPESYLGYAEILRAGGRNEEALEVYRRMRRACPDDWRGGLREAEMLVESDRMEEASAVLDQIEPMTGDEGRLGLNMLRNKIHQRRDEASLTALAADLAQAGDDPRKRLLYIERLITMDRGDQAVAECDRLLERHPELLGAVEAIIKRNLDVAMRGFRLRDFLADLYFRQERYDDALAMFHAMAAESLHPEEVLEEGCRKILARAPGHLAARLDLIDVLMKTQKWEGAIEAMNPLTASLPDADGTRLEMRWVEAAYRAGRIEDAKRRGLNLIERASDHLSFLVMLVRILEDSGDYQKAFEIYSIAEKRFPEDDSLRRMRRTVADNRKRSRMEALMAADAQGSLSPAEHYEKADLHREFDQIHYAIIHYQRAADDPDLSNLALTKMAICLCERRLFDMAEETLDQIELTKDAVRIHPELKDMFYWIADTLEIELHKVGALKYFKRLFRVDAAFKDVVARLERLDSA
jgi:tetratricopeptide (TPR) repeat protein